MRSIELFGGAGGLALGTHNAGFQRKLVFEWDKDACQTLRKNYLLGVHNWRVLQGDVRDHDFSVYQDRIEFVCGGPPCQPFSIGGNHGGENDRRNMFPEAVRAVREIRPIAFMFENVKGLLRRGFANYYQYIIHQLRYPTLLARGDEDWQYHLARLEKAHTSGFEADLRYNVVFKLLNAVDFGVPQHRWRVFIVGIRSDLGVEFSFPQPTHEEDALLFSKWISGDYWDQHEIPLKKRPTFPSAWNKRIEKLRGGFSGMFLRPWRTVRDAIADLPKIKMGEKSKKALNHFFNPGAKSYPGHDGSAFDEPAKTLKAGDHGVPGGENTLRLKDGSLRYFSVRECARLQTFPDNWLFDGSWTECMRQLGNAVPVSLSEAVASELKRTISKVKGSWHATSPC